VCHSSHSSQPLSRNPHPESPSRPSGIGAPGTLPTVSTRQHHRGRPQSASRRSGPAARRMTDQTRANLILYKKHRQEHPERLGDTVRGKETGPLALHGSTSAKNPQAPAQVVLPPSPVRGVRRVCDAQISPRTRRLLQIGDLRVWPCHSQRRCVLADLSRVTRLPGCCGQSASVSLHA
jgi:hypothetical protein